VDLANKQKSFTHRGDRFHSEKIGVILDATKKTGKHGGRMGGRMGAIRVLLPRIGF